MFEHLLQLFFHAKVGALAGLILVGTTGALVTATASSANGVTTITLTQASASPSANNQVQTSPTASPTARPTETPETTAAPNTTTTTPKVTTTVACDATQVAGAAAAVKTVDDAYSQYHTDLAALRKDAKSDAAKALLETTDKTLKGIRQNAVKAIHATVACAKAGDETEMDGDTSNDQTDANDADDDQQGDNEGDHQNGKDDNTPATTTPTTPAVMPVTGDPKTIADNAVAAMKVAFDTATSQLGTVNTVLTTPKPKNPNPTFHADNKGKGEGNHGD